MLQSGNQSPACKQHHIHEIKRGSKYWEMQTAGQGKGCLKRSSRVPIAWEHWGGKRLGTSVLDDRKFRQHINTDGHRRGQSTTKLQELYLTHCPTKPHSLCATTRREESGTSSWQSTFRVYTQTYPTNFFGAGKPTGLWHSNLYRQITKKELLFNENWLETHTPLWISLCSITHSSPTDMNTVLIQVYVLPRAHEGYGESFNSL